LAEALSSSTVLKEQLRKWLFIESGNKIWIMDTTARGAISSGRPVLKTESLLFKKNDSMDDESLLFFGDSRKS